MGGGGVHVGGCICMWLFLASLFENLVSWPWPCLHRLKLASSRTEPPLGEAGVELLVWMQNSIAAT